MDVLIYPKYLCSVCGTECVAYTVQAIKSKNKMCDKHYRAWVVNQPDASGLLGIGKPNHKKHKVRTIPNLYELYASKFSHREILYSGTFTECYNYRDGKGATRVAELEEDGYFVHIDKKKQKR